MTWSAGEESGSGRRRSRYSCWAGTSRLSAQRRSTASSRSLAGRPGSTTDETRRSPGWSSRGVRPRRVACSTAVSRELARRRRATRGSRSVPIVFSFAPTTRAEPRSARIRGRGPSSRSRHRRPRPDDDDHGRRRRPLRPRPTATRPATTTAQTTTAGHVARGQAKLKAPSTAAPGGAAVLDASGTTGDAAVPVQPRRERKFRDEVRLGAKAVVVFTKPGSHTVAVLARSATGVESVAKGKVQVTGSAASLLQRNLEAAPASPSRVASRRRRRRPRRCTNARRR